MGILSAGHTPLTLLLQSLYFRKSPLTVHSGANGERHIIGNIFTMSLDPQPLVPGHCI